jgi:diacylglycerol kinase
MQALRRFFHSFTFAWRGVRYVFSHEQNFRIQLVISLVVVGAMVGFQVRRSEVVVLLLLILLILILELLNSALEKFADIVKPRLAIQVQVVKDILAAMVLIASLGAMVIGAIIFWPYVFEMLY